MQLKDIDASVVVLLKIPRGGKKPLKYIELNLIVMQ
jgi:hypothetical protein